MSSEKLTKREEALAKRAGKGGREFVLARRKRPGLTLLEFQVSSDEEAAEDLDVTGTAGPPVEAAPVSEPAPTAKKTTAKKTTPGGSSDR